MKKAGKLPLAIDGFRHALNKGAPDDKAEAAVQYNLANTLFEERLYDQAIQSYSDAVKTKGESGFPQGEFCFCCVQRSDFDTLFPLPLAIAAEYNQAVTICEMANDVKYIKRIGAFLQLKAMLDEVTCDEKGLDLMKSDHAIRNLINDLGEDDHAAVVNAVEGKAMELVLAAEGGAAKRTLFFTVRGWRPTAPSTLSTRATRLKFVARAAVARVSFHLIFSSFSPPLIKFISHNVSSSSSPPQCLASKRPAPAQSGRSS